MDLERIEKLLTLLGKYDVREFAYSEGDWSVELRVGAAAAAPTMAIPQMAAPVAAAPAAAASDGLHIVRSPMVGTFYRSPKPGQASFCDVGDRVEAGKTICIVEAMKLMNEIESDVAGVVAEILVENGHAVEFGQPLFKIRRG